VDIKSNFSESDVCAKQITRAIIKLGWDEDRQIRREVSFTDGRIIVTGNTHSRGKRKRADFILFYKPNIPIAVIEAKDNFHDISDGIQQAVEYAEINDIPFAYSSNGKGFIEHDRTGASNTVEREIAIDAFPTPDELWSRYKKWKGLEESKLEKIYTQEYYYGSGKKEPRYYQRIVINRCVERISKGEDRVLLVMATGTGKTFVASQIAYRLWKTGVKKRILFLADRKVLIKQAMNNDFSQFKDKMTFIRQKKIDKSYEMYFSLYQGITDNSDEDMDAYKQFSRDFFDLVIIDECHRGSAKDDSTWREVLDYFNKATHLGMTATPKESKEVSNIDYFGEPIYTYSLRQGIADGFLAPYKVLRINLNVDVDGWRPYDGMIDKDGKPVEDKIYNTIDYDRTLVIDERTRIVAKKITEYLKGTNRYDKTIVFCVDIEHTRRMRQALINENKDIVIDEGKYKYIMQITGDNEEGKMELDNFIDPESPFPVIAVTSKLMTTGVDAQTCKLVVLDSIIKSPGEFKQIIGRGTRIKEEYGKTYFTIMDFRKVTDLFADPKFDGDPVKVFEADEDTPLAGIMDEKKYPIPAENGTDKGDPGLYSVGELVDRGKQEKVYVNNVDVSVLQQTMQYLDEHGKLITGDLKSYTKSKVLSRFKTLNEFLMEWNAAERKDAIIKELQDQGIVYENMKDAIKKEMDVFDMVLHAAFGRPPLSRRERAENVKKRDIFAKYGVQARQVLEILLEKYAEEGIENIEDTNILKVKPLFEMGRPYEIINNIFGGKDKYFGALRELENEIYRVA